MLLFTSLVIFARILMVSKDANAYLLSFIYTLWNGSTQYQVMILMTPIIVYLEQQQQE